MSLPEFAQISEENELLRDQLREQDELVVELTAMVRERDALINELKAQLNAKEEFATQHRQIESRDGYVWQRTVTMIEPDREQRDEVGA